MDNLARNEEKFPAAQTPGALTLGDVFARWRDMGLEPVEVSSDDLRQTITIEHDALTRQLKWTAKKMDGMQALGIMAQANYDMFRYFCKAQPRPAFTSGQAQIAVSLSENSLTVGLNPLHDPTVIIGALAAALFEVIERSRPDDPARAWQEVFAVEVSR